MISSLLLREISTKVNVLNIASNNIYFEKFLSSLNIKIFGLHDLYIGSCVPEIVITSNKTQNIDKTIAICKHHQCNLIAVDHEIKSDIIEVEKIQQKLSAIPNVLQIAVSEDIKNSWGDLHEIVLRYGNEKELKDRWQEIILTVKQKSFIYE
jgi:hypothetical protein